MKRKERLDTLLVQRNYFPSRQQAQGAILAGIVYVGGERVDKAGLRFDPGVEVSVKGKALDYVSRGGLKLEQAIEQLGFDPTGKVIIDIGASTGGFTDCALQYGAKKVFAVDVGYNQLAWALRRDPRVIVMERTNARYLRPANFPELADAITIDVSFISLSIILPAAVALLGAEGEIIALIKPQFEAGRHLVGKKGVVRDKKIHRQVIETVLQAAAEVGFVAVGLIHSPITGPEGNVEFLAYFKNKAQTIIDADKIENVVDEAHLQLS